MSHQTLNVFLHPRKDIINKQTNIEAYIYFFVRLGAQSHESYNHKSNKKINDMFYTLEFIFH